MKTICYWLPCLKKVNSHKYHFGGCRPAPSTANYNNAIINNLSYDVINTPSICLFSPPSWRSEHASEMGQVTIINGFRSRAVEKIDDKNMDFTLDRHIFFVNCEKLSLLFFYIDGKICEHVFLLDYTVSYKINRFLNRIYRVYEKYNTPIK